MNNTVLGLQFVAENCVQCHACEVACKTWHNLEVGVKWRRVEWKFKGSYPETKLLAASVSCMHCSDAPCAEACPVGAIHKNENGVVAVDTPACIGCRACESACPVKAPQFGADGLMQKCDMCITAFAPGEGSPSCASVCPTRAIIRREMTVEEKDSLNKALSDLVNG